MGISRYREIVGKAQQMKSEASTKVGARMLQTCLEGTTKAIAEALAPSGAGRPHKANKYLAKLEPEVVAFLTARTILDAISQRRSVNTAAVAIGSTLENEIAFRAFADQKAGLWHVITEAMTDAGMPSSLRQSRLAKVCQKQDLGIDPWTYEERAFVGTRCIDLFIQATGWAEVVNITRSKNRTEMVIKATEAVSEWINSEHSRCELLAPIYLPMIIPPRDWTSPTDGGYLSPHTPRKDLIKTNRKAFLEEVRNHDMTMVYQAVNAVQRTAWQVNTDILPVIQELFTQQSPVGKLPASMDRAVPPFPADKNDQEAIRRWRKEASAIHESNSKRRSKRIACAKALWVAEKFAPEPQIYFPTYCDFRGRIYCQPLYLTPQGADYSKALLRFADGIELGDQGACWLAIHGANVWGFDKAGLQARIEWVEEHEAQILRSATEPLDFHWWSEADKPLQFLAFCMEWAGYRREGSGFKSKLPVALDGSCNGLQNFSMMLRDPVGGAAVNLLPSNKPEDIYQRVADVVTEQLRLDLSVDEWVTSAPIKDEDGNETTKQLYHVATMARQWLDSGLVARKLCKGPVMTLPYGAREYGMRTSMVDFLREQADEDKVLPWDLDRLFIPAIYIVKHIWNAIGRVVVAAMSAMEYLQKVAKVAAEEGLPIHWTSPSGFPVMQEYRELVGSRLKTQIGGELVRITISKEGDTLDKRRQAAGISPNFVHSLDSAHLMRTVCMSEEAGIEDFAMIHDSFGTHAANTEALGVILRHAFVEQYRGDVLGEFHKSITKQLSEDRRKLMPKLPPTGTLDIEQVLHSDFFFA